MERKKLDVPLLQKHRTWAVDAPRWVTVAEGDVRGQARREGNCDFAQFFPSMWRFASDFAPEEYFSGEVKAGEIAPPKQGSDPKQGITSDIYREKKDSVRETGYP